MAPSAGRSPVHLLDNPASRGGRRAAAGRAVAVAIEAAGHDVIPLHPTGPADIADTVAKAHTDGMERLVVVGGDGLVHHVLPALATTDVILGIVPVGTGNDFARALGLPTRLPAAVAAALGPAHPVDLVAATDDRWAATVVTGGFSGQVNARANNLRFPPGQQRYTVATLAELRRLRPVTLTLTIPADTNTDTETDTETDGAAGTGGDRGQTASDRVEQYTTTLFAVANTRYFGGGMAICPTARPDDGLLDITIVGPTTPFQLARMLPSVFSGRHIRHPAVVTRRARLLHIDTDTILWADGEPFGSAGRLEAVARALQVAGSLAAADGGDSDGPRTSDRAAG
ncbi:MAG: diacylglycerol kinase family protein [Acidimicrobiia bacterium]|nr:diacylglycerol kinase family protein [Acidimicrobiia bacterium]